VWIKASIQDTSCARGRSLRGHNREPEEAVFNLRRRRANLRIEEGDLRPIRCKTIAKRLGVTEQDVVEHEPPFSAAMRRSPPIRDDGESGEWQDWLADDCEIRKP